MFYDCISRVVPCLLVKFSEICYYSCISAAGLDAHPNSYQNLQSISSIMCADLYIEFCIVFYVELHLAIVAIDLIYVLLSLLLFRLRNFGLTCSLSSCVVPLMLLHENLE